MPGAGMDPMDLVRSLEDEPEEEYLGPLGWLLLAVILSPFFLAGKVIQLFPIRQKEKQGA